MKDKIFLQTLKGEKTPRVPFWFMRQAGRYLPEYRVLRAEKNGFLAMAFDPDSASEITLQPIRRFGMSAAIIFSDILVVPYALGQNLEFVPGQGPKLNPIQDREGLSILSQNRFDQLLEPVYEALRLTSSGLKKEGFEDTALIGFAGSPWTVATYMIEGGGSKDYKKTKCFAYQDPEGFSQLIDLLVDVTAKYLIQQIKAGAEVIQLFDSWAHVLDCDQFEYWVVQPNKAIIERVRQVYDNIPIIGFPKGVGYNALSYVEKTNVDALGLDSAVNLNWAFDTLQDHVILQGNLDPFCLLAGGSALENAALKILNRFADKPFVFNLGHGINKDTPIAHVEQLVKIIQDFR